MDGGPTSQVTEREGRQGEMRCAATLCLVPSLRGGPWIYWDDLATSCRKAVAAGFAGVELFAASPEAVDPAALRQVLGETGLELAAVGTGAGKVLAGLDLADSDPGVRQGAREFIAAMMEFGAPFGAPAILGSMQGRAGPAGREAAREHLESGLAELDAVAARLQVPLIFEPLNRYESDLVSGLGDGAALLRRAGTHHTRLLADLFHMNIEEPSIEGSLREHGSLIGHVHLADSNRRPAGLGHTDLPAAARALRAVGYCGFVSAEAFPYPDPETAAAQTVKAFRTWFAGK